MGPPVVSTRTPLGDGGVGCDALGTLFVTNTDESVYTPCLYPDRLFLFYKFSSFLVPGSDLQHAKLILLSWTHALLLSLISSSIIYACVIRHCWRTCVLKNP